MRPLYSLYPAAEGGEPPYTWSLNAENLSWLSDGTSRFEGTPTLDDIRVTPVVLQVRDANGELANSRLLSITVLPPPGDEPVPLKLLTRILPDSIVGRDYQLVFAVVGGYPPYHWVLQGNHGKAGLVFSDTEGILSGTLTAPGTIKSQVTVTDRYGSQVSQSYVFQIVPAIPKPAIHTISVPSGRVNLPYHLAFSASGGYPPYAWRVVSGKLPSGLDVDLAGDLTGTPDMAGDWEFALEMTDSIGQRIAVSAPYSMRIYTAQGYEKLEIVTQSLPTFLVGSPVNFIPACQGGAPPYIWRTADSLPEGLRVGEKGLVGTPVKAGARKLELIVTDASGQTSSASFDLTVRRVVDRWVALFLVILMAVCLLMLIWLLALLKKNAGRLAPLEIVTQSIPNGRASMEYRVYLASKGGVGSYTWQVVEGELPPGLVISADGCISGIPYQGIGIDETQTVAFTVEVRDENGTTCRQQL